MALARFTAAGPLSWSALLLALALVAQADNAGNPNDGSGSLTTAGRMGAVGEPATGGDGADPGTAEGRRPRNADERAALVAQLMTIGAAACPMPPRLHPVSRHFLESYLGGRMATHQFQRYFSLPNSRYIPLAECLVRTFG